MSPTSAPVSNVARGAAASVPSFAALSSPDLSELPVVSDRGNDETTVSHLERLAELNHLSHPELLRAVRLPTGPVNHVRIPGTAPDGWTPGRGTQVCPDCRRQDQLWQELWRHPYATVCLRHAAWLHATCPACTLAFRSQQHSLLRPIDAAPATCGNPAGVRGHPCPQPLDDLPSLPAPADVCAAQTRIQRALADEPPLVLGGPRAAADYLAEIRALTVLLLHLAVRPGGEALAGWADVARDDATRSTGDRAARWGLAPPADPWLRGHALAAADRILTAPRVEDAAEALHPWTELTPNTGEGQLGWLADHTRMTPTLTRLIMTATARRRRISTLLDQPPPAPLPPRAIPQALPTHVCGPAARHLDGYAADDAADEGARGYLALCTARRHRPTPTGPADEAGSGGPRFRGPATWTDIGHQLGIPGPTAVTFARTGAGRLTCHPETWVQIVDQIASRLDARIDYRDREATIGRLVTDRGWYRSWARAHHPGSPTTSSTYAITWLWTTWAGGLLTTSPAWTTHPGGAHHLNRARYRRYLTRLTPPARIALTDLARST